jgi:hypothetical protein
VSNTSLIALAASGQLVSYKLAQRAPSSNASSFHAYERTEQSDEESSRRRREATYEEGLAIDNGGLDDLGTREDSPCDGIWSFGSVGAEIALLVDL